MITRIVIAFLALIATPSMAQDWGSLGPPSAPNWDGSGVIGNAVQQTCPNGEVFTAAQGGCPPGIVDEPTPVNTGYTFDDWTLTVAAEDCVEGGVQTGCRRDHGEFKFRITCGFSLFMPHDSIVAYGQAKGPHHHTVFGATSVNQFTNYDTIRADPRSGCAGGPLWPQVYWEPSILFEYAPAVMSGETVVKPAVVVPLKPNVLVNYYSFEINNTLKSRPLLGQAMISGVNPSDRLNLARRAEAGVTTDTSFNGNRLDGFNGWKCVRISDQATMPIINSAGTEALDGFRVRTWLGTGGADPWGGTCEGSDFELLAEMDGPECWNGRNPKSPNGRDHMRYRVDGKCPRGWWFQPGLTSIPHYPAYTHAMRQKMYLSSDRMSSNPAEWAPPGSTMHNDFIVAADSTLWFAVMRNCLQISVNGTTKPGVGATTTCDTHFFDDRKFLKVSTPPNNNFTTNPIVDAKDRGAPGVARKDKYGNVMEGSGTVDAHAGH